MFLTYPSQLNFTVYHLSDLVSNGLPLSDVMNKKQLREMLRCVHEGKLSVDDAVNNFKYLPYENLGYAMVDHHRALRGAHPETIFAEGKTVDQIVGIARGIVERSTNVMITRASLSVYKAVKSLSTSSMYHETAGIIVLNPKQLPSTVTNILIVSAGTSDINICEEAAVTAETMGSRVERLYDVGVSGIHRLFYNLEKINSSSVLVVIAGMDGALPSVVAGVTDKPVIAVPTSVGYGANFSGLAPLLTMLNSCGNGVTVVNIDNGYGAGYAATIINRIANRVMVKDEDD